MFGSLDDQCKKILDIVDGYFFAIDSTHKIEWANKKFKEDYCACKENDVTANKCYNCFQNDKPCEGCLIEKAFRDGSDHKIEMYREVNRKRCCFLLSISSIKDNDDRVIALVQSLRDITPEMEILQEKESLLEQSKVKLLAEERKSIELMTASTLAAVIAHRGNTKVASIKYNLFFIDLLINSLHSKFHFSTTDLAEIKDALKDSIKGVDQTVGLIDDIVRTTKQIVPKIDKQEMDIKLFRNEIVDFFSDVICDNPKIDIEVNYSDFYEETINLDIKYIKEVFSILLNNSLDAISGQGKITSKMSKDKYSYIISVHDDGKGIKKEVADKIFDNLFTTKQHGQGLGFGLAAARAILQKHGGDINLDQKCENGALFNLYIPLKTNKENDHDDSSDTAVKA